MAIPPGGDATKVIHDHPLCDGPESAWSTFFKDNEVLLQIDKDVRRLCPDISFFQQVCVDIVATTDYNIKLILFRPQNFRVRKSQTAPVSEDCTHAWLRLCSAQRMWSERDWDSQRWAYCIYFCVLPIALFYLFKKRKRIYQIFSAFVFCL